jgi:hypothetical protein
LQPLQERCKRRSTSSLSLTNPSSQRWPESVAVALQCATAQHIVLPVPYAFKQQHSGRDTRPAERTPRDVYQSYRHGINDADDRGKNQHKDRCGVPGRSPVKSKNDSPGVVSVLTAMQVAHRTMYATNALGSCTFTRPAISAAGAMITAGRISSPLPTSERPIKKRPAKYVATDTYRAEPRNRSTFISFTPL